MSVRHHHRHKYNAKMKTLGFRLTQAAYWLSIGVWLGALIMMAVAAGITFVTVKQYQPTLGAAPYDQLTDVEPYRILAGGIVGNILHGLAVVQVACALVILVCVSLQVSVYGHQLRRHGRHWANFLRLLLLVFPLIAVTADQTVVTPNIWQARQTMYDPAQPPAEREAARAMFDRLHPLSERMVGVSALALAAAAMISAFAFRIGDEPLVVDPRRAAG